MQPTPITFEQPDLLPVLQSLSDSDLDGLPFGVIGFDGTHVIRRYNAYEQRETGLLPSHTIGCPLFTKIAQCMNNYLVAQRFEDAAAAGQMLDATIDYVLTWRMKPTPTQLRLLAVPRAPLHYLVLRRVVR